MSVSTLYTDALDVAHRLRQALVAIREDADHLADLLTALEARIDAAAREWTNPSQGGDTAGRAR